MTLPLVYLVLRATGSGADVWSLLARPRTTSLLWNTLALAAVVTAASVALALPLAWLQARTDLPLRGFWIVATALPLALPTYVLGFAYVAALGPRGALQQVLAAPFGVQRLPELYGFGGAALVLTLATFPYVLLSVRAALRAVSPELEEASRALGVGSWRTFRWITLPLVGPALASGSLLVALYVLSDFGAVSLLRFETLTWAVYLQYQGSFDRALAAVFGLVLVAVAGLVLWLERLTRGRAAHYDLGPGVAPTRAPVRLGRWRWPALVFSGLVVALGLALPVAVIVSWLARGAAAGLAAVVAPLGNALTGSALAALAALLAGLPVAFIAARRRGRLAGAVESVTYLGYALPGIVVALALVFFGANYARPLYQTLGLLVFAYVVRFLPEAVGTARSALLQVSPTLEEAARSSGRGPLRAFADTTLRLAGPGVLAGAALVFLTVIKELPITLLLGPTGFKTLATSVWASAADARYGEAAGPALLLVAVSAGATLLLTGRGDSVTRG